MFIYYRKFEKYKNAINFLIHSSVYFRQQKFPDALLEVLDFCKNGLEIISSFPLVKSNRKMKKLVRKDLQNKSALKPVRIKYPAFKHKNKFKL